MAVGDLFPLYTQSPYAFTEGKVLIAQRAYVGPVATAAPVVALGADGAATPWVDLGSIDGSAAPLTKADPTILDVTTGLFEVLRGEVVTKDGDMTTQFTMVEYEPAAWAALTGDALITPTGGHAIFVGGRPVIQKAILLVGQNAATGGEFQHWNPKSDLTFTPVDLNKFQAIQVKIRFLKFIDVADTTGFSRDYKLSYFPSA